MTIINNGIDCANNSRKKIAILSALEPIHWASRHPAFQLHGVWCGCPYAPADTYLLSNRLSSELSDVSFRHKLVALLFPVDL